MPFLQLFCVASLIYDWQYGQVFECSKILPLNYVSEQDRVSQIFNKRETVVIIRNMILNDTSF